MFYLEDFFDQLKIIRYSPETIKKYASLLYHFERYLQLFGIFNVKNVSENEVFTYFKEIKKKKISESEYSIKVLRLKKYFQYL